MLFWRLPWIFKNAMEQTVMVLNQCHSLIEKTDADLTPNPCSNLANKLIQLSERNAYRKELMPTSFVFLIIYIAFWSQIALHFEIWKNDQAWGENSLSQQSKSLAKSKENDLIAFIASLSEMVRWQSDNLPTFILKRRVCSPEMRDNCYIFILFTLDLMCWFKI